VKGNSGRYEPRLTEGVVVAGAVVEVGAVVEGNDGVVEEGANEDSGE
jgi:hypothetical protein